MTEVKVLNKKSIHTGMIKIGHKLIFCCSFDNCNGMAQCGTWLYYGQRVHCIIVYNKTTGQSNLTTGRIAAAHGRFNSIGQVAPVRTPPINNTCFLGPTREYSTVQPFLHDSRSTDHATRSVTIRPHLRTYKLSTAMRPNNNKLFRTDNTDTVR